MLLNRLPELPPPALIVVVVDASNLQRNLYYATQVIELGHPTIHRAEHDRCGGSQRASHRREETFGTARRSGGADRRQQWEGVAGPEAEGRHDAASRRSLKPRSDFVQLPRIVHAKSKSTGLAICWRKRFTERRLQATAEALLLLSNEKALASSTSIIPRRSRTPSPPRGKRLERGNRLARRAIEGRYARIAAIQEAVTTELALAGETFSDKLDRVLTHKIWGTLIFVAVMALMFQSIFTFARFRWTRCSGGGLAWGHGWPD